MSEQIGSVEIKRLRIYPENPDDPGGSRDVAVAPGIFPLMRAGDRIWWPMRGNVSEREDGSLDRIGDGMFLVKPARDVLDDEQVSIVSKTFTYDGLAELMTEWGFVEGPEQRVAIKLFSSVSAKSEPIS